jgi:hypothetical protein
LLKFFDVRLKVGYLPNAVGSPDAAIEYDDSVLAFDIGGNSQRSTARQWDTIVRKRIPRVELFGHMPVSSSSI